MTTGDSEQQQPEQPPQPPYGEPAPQYGQPAPQNGQPAPQYGQPAPQYGQPPGPEYGPPPQYGQPAPPYGQPQGPEYGQPPPYGPPPQPGAYAAPVGGPPARVARRGVGVASLAVTAVGVVLVVLAFTVLKWLRNGAKGSFFRSAATDSKFSDLHDGYSHLKHELGSGGASLAHDLHFGIGPTYTGWLGWVLLGVAAALAVLAALPTAGAAPFRIFGLLVGLAAAALTAWTIDLIRITGSLKAQLGRTAPSYVDFIKHAGLGFWFAFAGFILIGVGAAIGPRRR